VCGLLVALAARTGDLAGLRRPRFGLDSRNGLRVLSLVSTVEIVDLVVQIGRKSGVAGTQQLLELPDVRLRGGASGVHRDHRLLVSVAGVPFQRVGVGSRLLRDLFCLGVCVGQ
jgi:hypothetical protein